MLKQYGTNINSHYGGRDFEPRVNGGNIKHIYIICATRHFAANR